MMSPEASSFGRKHILIEGAILLGGGDGTVHTLQQGGVALGDAHHRAFGVIGDLQHQTQLGILGGIALGHHGLDKGAVQLAGHQLGDDIGHLSELDDISVRGVLMRQIRLDRTHLSAI